MSVLLMGPANSPHTLQWRQAIAEQTGDCLLASLHPPAGDPDEGVWMIPGWDAPRALRPWRLVRSLRSLIARRRFDLVIAYYLTSYGLLASRVLPGGYVAAAAGSDIFPRSLVRIRRWAASRSARRARGALAWTQAMAERLTSLGAPADRILVGPRGIDLSLFRPPPAAAGPREELRVVSTRRLRPLFRLDRLVEAVARLSAAGRPVRLELIGEGSERRSLERLVTERGLEGRVLFSGQRSPAEVAEHLRRSDLFVSLSESDGLSASLLEAMACGLLPLVSDIRANREVVEDGRNGLVVRGDDLPEIVAALERAAGDRQLREKARRENPALARERFDLRRNTRTLLETAARWAT